MLLTCKSEEAAEQMCDYRSRMSQLLMGHQTQQLRNAGNAHAAKQTLASRRGVSAATDQIQLLLQAKRQKERWLSFLHAFVDGITCLRQEGIRLPFQVLTILGVPAGPPEMQ